MKLQGRILTIDTQGDDVRLLHHELHLLGFRLIPDDETLPGVFGSHTLAAVREFQEKQGLSATDVVDEETVLAINRAIEEAQSREVLIAEAASGEQGIFPIYFVRGLVQSADREPLKEVQIHAWDRSLREMLQLGDTATGADGRYEIGYPPTRLRRPDKGADLLVQAESQEFGIVSAPVILSAGSDETVDFVLGGPLRAPAAVERLASDLLAVLRDEEMSLDEVSSLDPSAKVLLAARSGVSPHDLTLLSRSQELANQTGLRAEVFYGLGRQKIPLQLPALLAQDPARLREAAHEALANNQIPAGLATEVEEALDQLDELSIVDALRISSPGDATTVGTLLAAAELESKQRETLVRLYAAHQGTPAEFWNGVRDEGVLSPEEISRTQLTLQLGTVTLNHAPLVSRLLGEGIQAPRELARFDRQDWLGMIRDDETGVPPELAAADLGEEDYADVMYRVVEDAFPTAIVAHRVQQLPDPGLLGQFFDRNQLFEMRTTPVASYLNEHSDALDGFSDDEKTRVVQRLKGIERTYHIAPPGQRIETISVLVNDGVDSAQKIRRMGRHTFENRYAPQLASGGSPEELQRGLELARDVFARADTAVAVAETLLLRHVSDPTRFYVQSEGPSNLDQFPDYQTLFGSLDFCSCGDCQSVYSPAAYLVDLLYWLHHGPKTADKSPLDVLFENRRGDIGGIELSCKNTNTPLPYIDLVNEVLELLVAPPDAAVSYQTQGSATDLAAHPEHLHDPAYETLLGDVYPFNLPFDLWLEEARTYLGHLGVPRHQLMAAFHAEGRDAALTDLKVARESLGLSPWEEQIVSGDVLLSIDRSWGLTGNAVAQLTKVSSFLERLAPPVEEHGRDFADLTDLLRARFLQTTETGLVEVWFDSATCDTSQAELTNLSEEFLDRCHRFVRLRRRLGWSVADLDRAVEVLGAGALDQPFLIKLALVQSLVSQLSVPLAQILAWWGPLDTRRWKGRLVSGRPAAIPAGREGFGFVYRDVGLDPQPADADDQSFYDRLFQAKSVSAAPDPAFGIDAAGTALANETKELVDHLPAVAAALSITAQDLGRLIPRLPIVEDQHEGPTLSLANLSALYRHVSLARTLGLTAAQLVSLLDLTRIDPFNPTHPEDTVRLIAEARAIRESGFSLDELDYLLRDQDTTPPALAPDDKTIGVFLRELRDTLRTVEAATPTPDDARLEESAIQKLAEAFSLPRAVADPVLRTLTAPKPLISAPSPARPMLDVFVHRTLIDFEPEEDAGPLPSPADLPIAFMAWRRLHKVALLLQRFRSTPEEIPWLFEHGPAGGTLDFDTLPIAPPDPVDIPPYAEWARLRDAFALRDRAAGGRLFDLFEVAATAPAGGREAFLTELALRTRWNSDDLDFLAGPDGFDLAYPADFLDERQVRRLEEALTMVRRVGQSASLVFSWRSLPPLFNDPLEKTQAQEIKQAVRARRPGDQWSTVARPLRDRLRELQRDALVSWLVAHDARFSDVNDLFGHLLIDVEMSPCQLTSRIKQAISSVQLFIGRAFLSLEPAVRFEPGDAREWKWRKSYRVWEANRKVFLYPENWIEPELRDDKSPFFKELEDQLLQGEVTDDAAEKAVRAYLERLDTVARLKVMGLYHQKDATTDILHVVACTQGTPQKWFYRSRVDAASWTPWEEVNLDIESDHVLPVIYNRQLYLFWALFTEAAEETVPQTPSAGSQAAPLAASSAEPNNTANRPQRYYQIRLAWSELRDGKWASKRLSPEQIGSTPGDATRNGLTKRKGEGNLPDSRLTDFFFRAFEESGDLIVEPIRRVVTCQVKSNDQEYTFYPRARLPGTIDDIPAQPAQPAQTECIPEVSYHRLDRFRLSGCDGMLTLEPNPATDKPVVRLPDQTEIRAQTFAATSSGGALVLPVPNLQNGAYATARTLDSTISPFEIVPLHQEPTFLSQSPFFFQDRKKTYFVEPYDAFVPPGWSQPAWTLFFRIALDPRDMIPDLVRLPLPRWPDPWLEDPASRVALPNQVDLVTRPALVAVDGQVPGDVLGRAASDLAATLDSRVAFINGVAVTARSRQLSIQATATYQVTQNGGGQELMRFLPPTLPGDAQSLNTLTLNSRFDDFSTEAFQLPYTPAALFRKWDPKRFRFFAFDHPFVCAMRRQINRLGLDGLFDPPANDELAKLRRQCLHKDTFSPYQPTSAVASSPSDEFDFSFGGAYSLYNWELFFHVPFLLAVHLSRNQRFEEAMRWFHFIFDPTESSPDLPAPQRFWKLGPFFKLFHGEDVEAGPIHELLLLLHDTSGDPERAEARQGLLAQIQEWRRKPFNPHAIARLRLTAYQKAVVMRYIDNLIEWGDQLFRRDTLESINEATQLYVLAAQLLGRRPRRVEVDPPQPRTFNQLLAAGLDELGNALVEEVEGYLPPVSPDLRSPDEREDDVPVLGPTLFFCIPPNDKLITGYWDRVADRLFKIRHCMNIEGVVRQLALFEPPIDPALLVRAAAAGIDLGSALADLDTTPLQRFQVLLPRAVELTGDVRALGAALLAALEKKDAETLALLRAGHEVKVQTALLDVRKRQIEEAGATVEGLQRSRENAEIRLRYYRSRQFMNPAETTQIALLNAAGIVELAANLISLLAGTVSALPDSSIGASGFGGSPVVTLSIGGSQFGSAARSIAEGLRAAASLLDRRGQMAGMIGGYIRRAEDWGLQGDLAAKEIEALEKQIVAAEIRRAIAERELATLELQIANSREDETFLREKYTNAQLYQWMVGQLSSLHFQSYQLAYDLAKRAERCFRFELGLEDSSYIQFGYWDSLKKGLLAGEKLQYDLRRLEIAYLDQNRREYELTRHVSLRQLDPVSLVELRASGECMVRIPEVWYDLDTPGHYLRRIKSVAVSLPSVTGPYVPVRCTLTLLKSSIRIDATPGSSYLRSGANDTRFRDINAGNESIVTSRAQEDSGLFETNLRDERYLPFEGAGAISEWCLELPKTVRQFDYDTISDVVLHVRYTARDGGGELRSAAEAKINDALEHLVLSSQEESAPGLLHLISLRQDFSQEWHRFLNPPPAQTNASLSLALDEALLPYTLKGSSVKISSIHLFLQVRDTAAYRANQAAAVKLALDPPGAASVELISDAGDPFRGLPNGNHVYSSAASLGTWTITFKEADNTGAAAPAVVVQGGHRRLNPAEVEDLIVALRLKVTL